MNFLNLFKNKISISLKYIHISNIYFGKLVNFKLSDIGEGIAEVQLKEWHIEVGDYVNEFDEICSVQSDKASVTITSRYKGIINKLYFQPDDIAKVGQTLLDIELNEENNNENLNEILQENEENNISFSSSKQKILASPAVRRLISEYKINLEEIKGTGQNGRILKEDILKIIKEEENNNEENNIKNITKRPIRGYTRSMIKTMTESLTIPHFVYGDEFLIEELIKIKELKRINDEKEREILAEFSEYEIDLKDLLIPNNTQSTTKIFSQKINSIPSQLSHVHIGHRKSKILPLFKWKSKLGKVKAIRRKQQKLNDNRKIQKVKWKHQNKPESKPKILSASPFGGYKILHQPENP